MAGAGIITNAGKTFAVSALAVGATLAAVHEVCALNGDGDHPGLHRHRVDANGNASDVTIHPPDLWKGFARGADLAYIVGGGLTLAGGAGSAAYDLSRAARALGETPVSDAVRGGKLLAHTEVLLGLGCGAVIAGMVGAIVTGNHGKGN